MSFFIFTGMAAFAMVWVVSFLCWLRRYDRHFWLTCQHYEEIRCVVPAFLAGMACVIGALVQNHLNHTSTVIFLKANWWMFLLTLLTMSVLFFSFQPFLKSKLHD